MSGLPDKIISFDKKLFFCPEDRLIKFEDNVPSDQSWLIEIADSFKGEGKLQVEGLLHLQEGAEVKIVIVSFSSRDGSVSIEADLKCGSRVECSVASIADKAFKKVFDIKTIHNEGGSYSLTKMYGVLLDKAQLDFLGTSDIKKGAKKSWTRQEGRIADFSSGGKGQVSPILKIAEDDVKASHGAALGKIPEDSLFYMMTRGLTKKQATGLMTIGYLKPVVNEISNIEKRDELLDYVSEERFTK